MASTFSPFRLHRYPLPLLHLLLLLFSASMMPPSSSFAEDCDPRCQTENCDGNGICLCDLPSNSTTMLGDRPFYGGYFCDIPQTMCDGTNSFWCQNGTCNEIVRGESYSCICHEGFGGTHCELEGKPCGDYFCFRDAECIQGDVPCDCPIDWMGSEDCLMPTWNGTVFNYPPPSEPVNTNKDKANKKWYIPVIVAAIVAVIAISISIGVYFMRKRAARATVFHKIQQVQLHGFVDEDEEAFVHGTLSKAEIA